MKKKETTSCEQGNLIDFKTLLTQSQLSENEQGIIKRRLLENSDSFGKVLQLLAERLKQETSIPDLSESLKLFKKKESKIVRSFDSIAKILSWEFPQLLQFILEEYQVEAEKTQALVGKEFIAVKRIADVIFEAKDKNGYEIIVHLEFESEYESDEKMDKRKLEYRHLMEMDEAYQGKAVLCNVFYLRGSPEDKEMVEDRTVKLPTADSRYTTGELKYKAYHLSLVTIETMLKRKLPFLLPFIVEAELRGINDTSKSKVLVPSLQTQIDEHEVELNQMIDALSASQMESLRTTVEYLWGKSYSEEVFNKSTLLKLMREQLNFRQKDIEWGRREGKTEGKTEGITEGIAKRTAQEMNVLHKMLQEGKITHEQMEYFLKRMAEEDEKKQSQSSTDSNKQ